MALLFVPPLLIGLANSHSTDSMTGDCPSYTDAGPGPWDCVDDGPYDTSGMAAPADSVPGVWTQDVTDSTAFTPMLGGSPKVWPVPPAATALRVEIVSTASLSASPAVEAQVDTTAGDVLLDSWRGSSPHALQVNLVERPSELSVSVDVTDGSGTVQCRVYADGQLVAVDTSDSHAICSPAL